MNNIREFTLNNTCFKETIFNGYYITQNGDIAQIKFNKNGKLKKFLLMEHEITKNGYHRIEINNKHYFIHRIVYQTWSNDELKNDMVVDHIDSNPSNNNIKNLRQVTQKKNIQNAIYHGNFGHNHNTVIEVYDNTKNEHNRYNSVKEFMIDIGAPEYMIKHGGLSSIRKRKEYNKYSWKKINEH